MYIKRRFYLELYSIDITVLIALPFKRRLLSNVMKTMLLIASDRTPVNTSSLTKSSVNPSGRVVSFVGTFNRA